MPKTKTQPYKVRDYDENIPKVEKKGRKKGLKNTHYKENRIKTCEKAQNPRPRIAMSSRSLGIIKVSFCHLYRQSMPQEQVLANELISHQIM